MIYILIFLSFLLFGCAESRYLFERGWSQEKRVKYIEKHKVEYSKTEIDAFINNNIQFGMPKSLISKMIGKPNKMANDTCWIYTYKDSVLLLMIDFDEEGKAQYFSY